MADSTQHRRSEGSARVRGDGDSKEITERFAEWQWSRRERCKQAAAHEESKSLTTDGRESALKCSDWSWCGDTVVGGAA